MVSLLGELKRSRWRGFLLVPVAMAMIACSEEESGTIELTYVQAFMQDPTALARGEALFQGSCAGYCHTLTPEESEASFLFDCEWDYGSGDDEIFAIMSDGIPDTRMVGFGDNFPGGDEDKWKIIAFLRTNQQTCE